MPKLKQSRMSRIALIKTGVAPGNDWPCCPPFFWFPFLIGAHPRDPWWLGSSICGRVGPACRAAFCSVPRLIDRPANWPTASRPAGGTYRLQRGVRDECHEPKAGSSRLDDDRDGRSQHRLPPLGLEDSLVLRGKHATRSRDPKNSSALSSVGIDNHCGSDATSVGTALTTKPLIGSLMASF